MKRAYAILLAASCLSSNCAARGPSIARQRIADSPDLWRLYAGKLPIGSAVTIRTSDGDHFNASLLSVDDDGITVKPRTRVAEPVRHLGFDRLDQLEIERENSGPGARAAAIGVGIGTGIGAFFGLIMAVCLAGACGG